MYFAVAQIGSKDWFSKGIISQNCEAISGSILDCFLFCICQTIIHGDDRTRIKHLSLTVSSTCFKFCKRSSRCGVTPKKKIADSFRHLLVFFFGSGHENIVVRLQACMQYTRLACSTQGLHAVHNQIVS